MDAIYSEAFEHLPNRQAFGCDQNPDDEENIRSALRKRSSGGRNALKKKSYGYDTIDDDAVGEYIDSSEVNPRIPSPIHFQRKESNSHIDVMMRNNSGYKKGHQMEESQKYQYAFTPMSPAQRGTPATQRSVSLKDDYSDPPDRLSKSNARPNSESQDYIEPYQSQVSREGVGVSSILAPDPGDIYELAKDITPPPTQTTAPHRIEDYSRSQYNHIVSHTTNSLQNTKIDEDSGNYDHLNTFSTQQHRKVENWTFDQDQSHKTSVKSMANIRQGSATPEDFFLARDQFTNQPCKYEDLPSDYSEPWDTEEGQKKFSRLMQKAERTDERRSSTDKTSIARGRHLLQTEGAKQPKHGQISSPNQGVPIKSQSSLDSNANLYGCAWDPSTTTTTLKTDKPSSPEIKPSVPPHRNRKPIIANYEEAWDTEAKQRQFEEKLEKVRKQRVSEGKISEKDIPDLDNETNKDFEPVFSGQPAKSPPPRQKSEPKVTSPVLRQFDRENVSRSDSCKSLAALAEKIDKTIPLEDQSFFHGSLKRSNAERMLCVFKDGSYLIRRSESNKKDFSLTLKGWNGIPMHMKITSKPNGTYVLGENSPPFHTIPEMVEYYTRHELPVQDAERICLLYPIPS